MRWHKAFCLLLTMLIGLSPLAACGEQSPAPDETASLRDDGGKIPPEQVKSGYTWFMPYKEYSNFFLEGRENEWSKTAQYADTWGYAVQELDKFTDEEQQRGFALLNERDIGLGIELGVLKEWARGQSAEWTYALNKPMLKRFVQNGANLVGLAFDEPLINVRWNNDVYTDRVLNGDDDITFTAKQVADYMRRARADFPGIALGDIEVHPYFSSDELIRYIDAVELECQKLGIDGMDFFRLDSYWAKYGKATDTDSRYSWTDLIKVEQHCRKRGIAFSLIIIASGHEIRPKLANDPAFWYNGVMEQAQEYLSRGGDIDQYCFESWLADTDGNPIPSEFIPETTPNTFSHSFVNFYERFIAPTLHP